MASGVTVADACKKVYEEIKKDKKHRYVVFHIKDEKQIDIEVIGERNSTYDLFLEDLQKAGPQECRYGLFDFEYTHQCQGTSESSKKQKLFLLCWCPDTAKVKKKMVYSSSYDALKKSLVGVHKAFQATDHSEASQEVIEEKLRSTDRHESKKEPVVERSESNNEPVVKRSKSNEEPVMESSSEEKSIPLAISSSEHFQREILQKDPYDLTFGDGFEIDRVVRVVNPVLRTEDEVFLFEVEWRHGDISGTDILEAPILYEHWPDPALEFYYDRYNVDRSLRLTNDTDESDENNDVPDNSDN